MLTMENVALRGNIVNSWLSANAIAMEAAQVRDMHKMQNASNELQRFGKGKCRPCIKYKMPRISSRYLARTAARHGAWHFNGLQT